MVSPVHGVRQAFRSAFNSGAGVRIDLFRCFNSPENSRCTRVSRSGYTNQPITFIPS